MTATQHFVDRAVERIGCTPLEAVRLADEIVAAIYAGRTDFVEFVCRTNRNGHRLFRFRMGAGEASGGRTFYALIDTGIPDDMRCVTVMPAGFTTGRQGKAPLYLRDTE